MADRDRTGGCEPLHGEFVVSDANGGYTTMLTQTGTVTAVSATSITVKSDDGYTQIYMISPTTGSARHSPSKTRSRFMPPRPTKPRR